MTKNKGFTLIELMVVIAIIGILSAIILTILGGARSKGKDATIESEMKSLQNQIELVFIGGGYDTAFTNVSPYWDSSNSKISELLVAIDKLSPVGHIANSNSAGWAVQVRLASDPNEYFCVDTSGKITTSTTQLSPGDVICP